MKKSGDPLKRKSAVGGLVGRSIGGHIENCHFKGEITIHGNPEDVDVGGLVGRTEKTEIVNSSADAKVEFADETHPNEPIIELRPNLYGIGVNLRVLFKRTRAFFCKGSQLNV